MENFVANERDADGYDCLSTNGEFISNRKCVLHFDELVTILK